MVVQAPKPTSPRETWRNMDTQQDALHVMEFRLEGEVQEYITMTFVVRELKSALGKKKIILEL